MNDTPIGQVSPSAPPPGMTQLSALHCFGKTSGAGKRPLKRGKPSPEEIRPGPLVDSGPIPLSPGRLRDLFPEAVNTGKNEKPGDSAPGAVHK
ncbi:MAG: hypothetical protein NT040_09465 [Bacteroidetes bacterium]|nr:hypothetical protein [Bacteroidota bacterium]